MICTVTDLKYKDVINIKDGTRLGAVCDVEIDTQTSKIISLIIYGRYKLFGLFFKDDDIIIPWNAIEVIGEDTILVCHDMVVKRPRKKSVFLS